MNKNILNPVRRWVRIGHGVYEAAKGVQQLGASFKRKRGEEMPRMNKKRKVVYQNRRPYRTNNKIDRVTTQKDYADISIRRNKRNARKAKKWKRYVKRVNKAIASSGPSKKIVKTYSIIRDITAAELNADREPGIPWGAIGRQEVIHLPMFQWTSNLALATQQLGDDINEMQAVLTQDEALNTDQTITPPVFIKSGLWEFIMTNFSGNSVYADVYHYTCRKTGVYDFNDLLAATDAQIASGPIPAAGTRYINTPGLSDYGWTPYQSRVLMQYINIFKKERYLMTTGQSVQLERRMKVNKSWRKEQTGAAQTLIDNKMVKGISQGVIIIVYGAPQNNENQRITGQLNFNVSCNKSLFFDRGTAKEFFGNADYEWRTYQGV